MSLDESSSGRFMASGTRFGRICRGQGLKKEESTKAAEPEASRDL